ncbi:conserved hypothetical protein [uncultured Dysgonomonas sp.]|uniref:Zinc-ribbon domain-containing protein n=1 Tax=uncultured Dysgonomonas sp. TaxID=206096 RepID=A0A212J604_9BACT|nr:zinc ribbon domain-containing protein [uncultured Dysgonomonas sp.]SBV94863.1 conserved hypothetical protein [uncultured Dysgonomonas sp.]
MALINCSECGKEVSDKAASCPNCGNPIVDSLNSDNSVSDGDSELLEFPELPSDLNVGKQIVNWGFDAAIKGFYDRMENTISAIPHGEINVVLHTHGIQVYKGLTFFPIHNSQIISIKTASKGEIVSANKSVIGRAVAGGLILGPLGAIVGGMSGIGSKDKFVDRYYLIINYWDISTKSAQTILISGQKGQIDAFLGRHEKEKQINVSEDRVAEQNSTPPWAIICIIIIIVSLFVIIAT